MDLLKEAETIKREFDYKLMDKQVEHNKLMQEKRQHHTRESSRIKQKNEKKLAKQHLEHAAILRLK